MAGSDSLELEPVADDGIRAVQVGLALWAMTGGVLLLQHESLAVQGRSWWLVSCGAGLVIGVIEWGIFARRAASRRARAGRGASHES